MNTCYQPVIGKQWGPIHGVRGMGAKRTMSAFCMIACPLMSTQNHV
jgi:hypothetical protein